MPPLPPVMSQQVNNPQSTYHERNTHSFPKSSGESSNRPNKCVPTMPNLPCSMTVNKILIEQGQTCVNSEIEGPNISVARKEDSVHQPRQTSSSELREQTRIDTSTSSGPNDLKKISFDELWRAAINLFIAIQTGSLRLFCLGREGSAHKEKDDAAAASFCRDLFINRKSENLVIEDNNVYSVLLNHIPSIKGWLQAAKTRTRSGKIPINTKRLMELYDEVEREEPLPRERDGPLPVPFAKMIMERGKAYNESERSKKRTGNSKERFEQQDKKFEDLGVKVNKELDLLKDKFLIVREALKKGPNEIMDKIGECMEHIQKNWHGVQPVDKEPTHSGRSATKAFKKRQDVCAEAAKNEPRVKQLLDLIRHLRELLSREKCRLTDPEGNPAPDSASKLNEDSERCLDFSEDLFDPKVNVPNVMQPSAPPRELPETTPPCVFDSIHSFGPSSSTVPQTETPFVSVKACNVPLDRKRIPDNELNNREGEGKRFKVNENSQPSQQHVAGDQYFDRLPPYTSSVNNLTGSMPRYNWESPGAPSATLIASANQFQINRTTSQQPNGQPNPNIGGISSESGYQSANPVPQYSPYDDSQDDFLNSYWELGVYFEPDGQPVFLQL